MDLPWQKDHDNFPLELRPGSLLSKAICWIGNAGVTAALATIGGSFSFLRGCHCRRAYFFFLQGGFDHDISTWSTDRGKRAST
mmetsp:Transcript_17570/g.36751  ORF Transcript_17570/g.36751 Transcript_17570/m.36751 type:complete len:83 (+) Transcript_17570:2-250(+)